MFVSMCLCFFVLLLHCLLLTVTPACIPHLSINVTCLCCPHAFNKNNLFLPAGIKVNKLCFGVALWKIGILHADYMIMLKARTFTNINWQDSMKETTFKVFKSSICMKKQQERYSSLWLTKARQHCVKNTVLSSACVYFNNYFHKTNWTVRRECAGYSLY